LGGGGNATRIGKGVAGTNGLGGGGGGVGNYGAGGNGGSGIVVVRYKGASAGTGGTVTTGTGLAAGYTLHTFTNTGTSALNLSGLNLNSRLGAVENGVISGSGGLTFNGPGTLTLGAANTFTGDTRVGSGTLKLNHSNALAASTLNMASSDDGTVAFGLTGNNTYNIGGITGSKNLAIGGNSLSVGANNSNSTYSGQISGTGSLTKSGTGTVTLSGTNSYSGGTTVSAGKLAGTTTAIQGAVVNDAAVEFNQSTNGTYAGAMSGTGTLVKNGAGAITLTAANSYTGGTTINSGSLLTSTANRLADSGGVAVASGAIFQLGGNETIASLSGAGQVTLGTATLTTGASDSTFSGTLSGAGDLVKAGAGSFTLSGNNGLSTFTGDAYINAGTLVLASANALNAGTVVTMTGGTLTVNQRTIIGALEQGTGVVNGTGELVSALTVTSSGALNGILADGVDYSAGILKRSAGTTTVGAANSFTGAIKVQGGTLQLANGGSFNTASSLTMSADGTMDLNSKSQSFSAVNGTGGTVALGNGTLGVNGSSDSNFAGSITGNGSLTKSGTGTLALTGASSYTGATVVSDGLLVVNGSISTSSLTTIQSGATLGGSGTVGALTVDAGGTVAPGNSPGILMTGDYNQAGTLSLELNGTLAGVEYDQVNVSGTVNLSGQLTATIGYTPVNDQMLFILINDGSDAIVGNFSGMAHLDTVLLDGYLWQISYTANYTGSNTGSFSGGNDIALKAIPEPSALVLFGLSTFCLITRRRRTA
jgi:autotransporter-associated beta strand protein